MMGCHRTDAVVAAVAADRLHERPELVEHMEHCAVCQRAAAGELLDRSAQLTEDDIAFYVAGMADEATSRRVETALERDMSASRLVRSLQEDDAGPGEGFAARVRRWLGDLLGVQRGLRLAGAAAAFGLVVALLWLGVGGREMGSTPGPGGGDQAELLRGSYVEVELTFPGGRTCSAVSGSEASVCRWRPATEALGIHYRCERGAPLRNIAVAALDSEGDLSLIVPPVADAAWTTRVLAITSGRAGPDCNRGFCELYSAEFDVPPGRLELRALFTGAPINGAELRRLLADPASAQRAGHVVQRFYLDVQR